MMGDVLRALGLTRQRDETVVIECRRCGANGQNESDPCSNCGNESVVRYEIR